MLLGLLQKYRKVRSMILNEETKVTINLVLMIGLIVGVVSLSFAVGVKLTSFDDRISIVEESMCEHEELRKEIDFNSAKMATQDIKLAEILTDLKWIRKKMEEDD